MKIIKILTKKFTDVRLKFAGELKICKQDILKYYCKP